MSTYRNNSANLPSAATTTSFRNWIQDCVTMFGSIGLTKAADTGMLDETTVTWPGVISTMAGYQIWYLDDSLHATYPLYIRFGWGQGASGTRMIFNYQIGYATNGTGSLTGWTSAVSSFQIGSAGASSTANATGINCGSGGEGYVWFINGRFGWNSGSQTTPFFCLQREHDSNGAVVNGGNWAILFQGVDPAQYFKVYSVNRTFATTFGFSHYFCMTPFSTTQSGSATETELWRHFGKFPHVANLGATATYMSGDIQIDAPFTAEVTGAVRTWLPIGVGYCSVDIANASHMLAALWE